MQNSQQQYISPKHYKCFTGQKDNSDSPLQTGTSEQILMLYQDLKLHFRLHNQLAKVHLHQRPKGKKAQMATPIEHFIMPEIHLTSTSKAYSNRDQTSKQTKEKRKLLAKFAIRQSFISNCKSQGQLIGINYQRSKDSFDLRRQITQSLHRHP